MKTWINSALLLFVLLCYTLGFAQATTKKGDIYIPLKNKTEVTITPLLDTLEPNHTYKFILRMEPKFIFSELYLDKGVAMRTDSVLSIKASNKNKNKVDTATFRIIGFSNNNRILLSHKFIINPDIRVYPHFNKKLGYIIMNNNALERNMKYNRRFFSKNAIFSYEEGNGNEEWEVKKITISIINSGVSKNLGNEGNLLSDNMQQEINRAKPESYCYIKLDVKSGRKTKSVLTRFTLQ